MSDARARKAGIAIRVTAILSQFWTEDSPDELRAVELEGWIDVLGGVSTDELRVAWADYQNTGPRSGADRLSRPDAGAIMQRIVKARSYVAIIDKARRLPPPEPAPKVRVSAEERAKIMAEVWGREDSDPAYSPKTFPKVGANTENPDV